MAIPSPDYWRGRSAARMDDYLRDSEATLRIIRDAHKQAQAGIQAAIDRLYARMGKAYQLGPEEIRKLLAQPAGRAEYENLLKTLAGIKNKALRRPLEARAASGAYAFRVSRLEALRDNIKAQVVKMTSTQLQATTAGLAQTIGNAYQLSIFDIQRGINAGFPFAQLNAKAVEEILRNPWSGQSFSSRIWQNQAQLAAHISKDLTAGFMTGRSNKEMARGLADAMGVSYANAVRLVRTETNYMANAAEMESYKEAGVDRYEFMATLDNRTSEVCQDLDGKVFDIKDAKPSENMPPMHPYCRSTTVAHFDDDAVQGLQRRARDPITGKNVLVPRDMKYKDWKASFKGHKTDNNLIFEKQGHLLIQRENGTIHINPEKYGGNGVRIIGKIDPDKIRSHWGNVKTTVVLTDERIEHICEDHKDDYDNYGAFIPSAIEEPDYILEDDEVNTALYIKCLDSTNIKVVVRLQMVDDGSEYENSVITMHRLGQKTLKSILKKRKIVYKR